jgi:hypothetical protein
MVSLDLCVKLPRGSDNKALDIKWNLEQSSDLMINTLKSQGCKIGKKVLRKTWETADLHAVKILGKQKFPTTPFFFF